jgi:hypothetical protein
MSEIDPAYRTYRGLARRDLETAIRAGRVRIRGCPVGPPESMPEEIKGPITPDYELDLIHDSLKERRAGPLQTSLGSMTLFRSIEIEWTGAASYLRSLLEASGRIHQPPAAAPDRINPQAAKRKRGRHPKKLEATKDAMRTNIKEGTIALEDLHAMPEKEIAARFCVSRFTAREARKAILSEYDFVGNSIPDK